MQRNVVLAVLLIVIGVVALSYSGITYTTREKVLDIGPIKATKEKEHTVPIPPIVGAVALGGGIVLLVLGRQR